MVLRMSPETAAAASNSHGRSNTGQNSFSSTDEAILVRAGSAKSHLVYCRLIGGLLKAY